MATKIKNKFADFMIVSIEGLEGNTKYAWAFLVIAQLAVIAIYPEFAWQICLVSLIGWMGALFAFGTFGLKKFKARLAARGY